MAHFTYSAERADHELYRGRTEAADRFDLYEIIRREGGRLVSFSEVGSHDWFDLAYWNARISTIKEYDKILFARNLGAMLGAGLSLARALAVMERQTKNLRFLNTISQITNDIRHGDALNIALGNYPHTFSRLFVAMTRAGEEGGDLSGSLAIVADQMERMYTLKKKIRGALIYPAIIIIAIIGIGATMMIYVVPTLASTFKEMNADLPTSTKIVIGISDFLSQNTILAAVLFMGIVAAVIIGLKTSRGKRAADFIFLRVPMIGAMVREVNAARTARTLSSLLTSGVSVLTALEIVEEVIQNSYFKEVINASAVSVGQGEPISAVFARREDLFPAFVGEMMAVGEETGQLAEMMKRLALFYEDEVDRKTKDLSTIIEPFLMLIIGAAVGFFAVSMIAPIYSLSNIV
ncbi:MAG: Type IV pilin [Candidatus Kaiserbacteria bacterium GW2011_GWC2_52_8b]|uniref:Type IV pilin n=2 Tax=Candidatus Kaiseribacteriota TaxID=1752734 RepID=A0A0G1XGI4_9BACT|nr:MAG: Type IV pilin [Candidatus Kaiserbacteria bacterium GW2011_GWA2_52_12]KKW30373.1 MAG: Type IV pilin [Candidatus Kaiserbacteria bacterium GW2011_GWC2_52_8b]